MPQSNELSAVSDQDLDQLGLADVEALAGMHRQSPEGVRLTAYLVRRRRHKLGQLAAEEARLDSIVRAAQQVFGVGGVLWLGRIVGLWPLSDLPLSIVSAGALLAAVMYVSALYYRYRCLLPVIRERAMLGGSE